MEHVNVAHCAYDQDNQLLFDYHVFSTLTMLPVAGLLLYNTYLRRLYLPLARLVNSALLFRMVSAALFFLSYPYQNGISNCPEIILSKVTTIIEMFAELHQIYFIGVILGIGTFNACISRYFSLSLVQVLKLAFVAVTASTIISFFFFRGSLSFAEDVCTVFVSLTQLYVIDLAENVRDEHFTNSIVSVRDSSISLFKSLSVIQLFLSVFSLLFRVAVAVAYIEDDVHEAPRDRTRAPTWTESIRDAASVMLAIDYFSTYLFYIKVILIREKSKNVTVEIVQA